MDVQLGILFGLTAMLGWGISDFIGAHVSRKIGPFRAFVLTGVVTSIFLLILIPFFFKSATFSSLTIILVLITAFLYMVAGLSYYKGLTVGDVSIVSPVGSSYPILTVILSVLFLGENLTGLQIAAIASAIIGSVLVSFRLKDLLKLSTKRLAKG